MTQRYETRTKIKKIEDSFTEKCSDSDQDDTKIQLNDQERPNNKSSKIQNKSIKINKKQEHLSEKISPYSSQLKTLKKQQDDFREEDQKKEETIFKDNIKNDETDEQDEKSSPKKQKNLRPKSISNRIKQTRSQTKKDEMQKMADELMDSIDKAYEQDVELYKKKKPADRKLKLMPFLSMKLKELQLAKSFMKMDGLFLFVRWLYPNQQTGQQTSLTVRMQLLDMVLDLKVTKQIIENCEELQEVIKKYRRSKFLTLRETSEKIIKKWKIIKALPDN